MSTKAGGTAIELLVSHSWRDTATADRLAEDLLGVGNVVLDVRGIRSRRPTQADIEGALARTDAVILVWTPSTASSAGVTTEIETADRVGVPVFPCTFVADHSGGGPDLPDSVTVRDPIDFNDESAGFARLCLALLTELSTGDEPPAIDVPDGEVLTAVADHINRHRDLLDVDGDDGETVTRVLTALARVEQRELEAEEQLEEGMSLAEKAMEALGRTPADRAELESILVSVSAHEREFPGLMRRIRRNVERAIAELPPVELEELRAPSIETAPHEDRHLRMALAGTVAPTQLDDALDAVTHYLESAPATLRALHRVATTRSSPAVGHAVETAEGYFNQADDLLPDHFGIIGRLDDCWLVHNLAFRVVEAGLATTDELPGEWIRVLSADALVIALLPEDVLHGLESLLLTLLSDLATEAVDYEPEFAHTGQGHFEPTISRENPWATDDTTSAVVTPERPAPDPAGTPSDPAATPSLAASVKTGAPADETAASVEADLPTTVAAQTTDGDAAWGSPEVSLFLGNVGLAVSLYFSLSSLSPLIRGLVFVTVLLAPLPIIALGANGVIRMVRVLTSPEKVKDLPGAVRGARREQQARQRNWRPRLIVEMALVLAAIAVALFVLKPWMDARLEDLEKADSREIAIRADAAYSESIDLGLLMALEAYRTYPTPEAMGAILTGLATSAHLIYEAIPDQDQIVAISPDMRLLAIGGDNGSIRLFNMGDGTELETVFDGHEESVTALAFSRPLGRQLISGDANGDVRQWDVATGASIAPPTEIHPDRAVRSIGVSSDGLTVMTAGADDRISIWARDRETGLDRLSRSIDTPVFAAALSPDGTEVAAAALNDVVIFETDSGDERGRFVQHESRVRSLAFNNDGALVASVDIDGQLGWLNPEEPEIGLTTTASTNPLRSVAFSDSANCAIVAGDDGEPKLYEIGRFQADLLGTIPAAQDFIDNVAVSSDCSVFATAGSGGVKLFSVEPTERLSRALPNPAGGINWATDFDSTGEILVVGAADGNVSAWNSADGTLIDSIVVGNDAIRSVDVNEAGNLVVGTGAGTIVFWNDVGDLQSFSPLGNHEEGVGSVAFLGDGSEVISGSSDSTVAIWDPVRRTIGRHRPGTDVRAVASSPDGKRVVSGGSSEEDNGVFLWDVSCTDCMSEDRNLAHNDGVWAVAYHPRGSVIASGGDDDRSEIVVWDPDGSSEDRIDRIMVAGAPARVFSLAFSPDGRILAAGVDNSVQLFDVSDGYEPLGPPLPGHDNSVRGLAFDAAGTRLATASADGTVRIWTLDPLVWIEGACGVADRNPSLDEWNEFRPDEDYVRLCPDEPVGVGAPENAPGAEYRAP